MYGNIGAPIALAVAAALDPQGRVPLLRSQKRFLSVTWRKLFHRQPNSMVPCIYRSQLRWTYEDGFGRTPCDLELRTYKGDRAPTFQVSKYRLFGSGFSYWGIYHRLYQDYGHSSLHHKTVTSCKFRVHKLSDQCLQIIDFKGCIRAYSYFLTTILSFTVGKGWGKLCENYGKLLNGILVHNLQ